MKKVRILRIVGAVLVGIILLALGSLFTRGSAAPAPQGPPAYSLSAGNAGMVSGSGYYYDFETADALPPEAVAPRIQAYLDRQNNPDLVLAGLTQFDLAYQADIVERSTGRHAFGLMVSAAQISPEAGPNVFWNTKYGPLIAEVGGGYGMLGRLLPQKTAGEMTVTEPAAQKIAAEAALALNNNLTLGNETATFYGYFEFNVLQAGKQVGVLDVNGYSGQTWFKDWGRPPRSSQDMRSGQ